MNLPVLTPLFQTACDAVGRAAEQAVNAMCRTDEDFSDALQALDRTDIRLEFTDLGISIEVQILADGIRVTRASDAQPDILVRGSFATFATLPLRQAQGSFEFDGIEMTGDLKRAQRVYRIYQSLDFDYEELLSQRIGDIPARTVCTAVRRLRDRAAGAAPGSTIAGAFKDRLALLPHRQRVDQFMDDVDTLAADVERLEQRVLRLGKEGAA